VANVTLTAASILGVVPSASLARVGTYVDTSGITRQYYVVEAHAMRELRGTSTSTELTRVFYVHGTNDPTKAEGLGPAIGSYDTELSYLVATSRHAAPYASGGGEADIVKVDLTFSLPETGTSGGGGDTIQTTFAYDFGGESEHVEVAISQTAYPAQSAKVDANIIGFNGESIDGVDINAPIIEFTEQYVFTPAQFNPFYRKMLYVMGWAVNAYAFREYDAGEVQFAGASANKQNGSWYVTFRFRVHRNVEVAVPINGVDTVVTKAGWDYLWYQYKPVPGSAGQPVKQTIEAAYVAQVYKQADFSVLGIGTSSLP